MKVPYCYLEKKMGAIFFHLVEMPQGEPEPFLVFLVWGFNFVKGLEDPNKSSVSNQFLISFHPFTI